MIRCRDTMRPKRKIGMRKAVAISCECQITVSSGIWPTTRRLRLQSRDPLSFADSLVQHEPEYRTPIAIQPPNATRSWIGSARSHRWQGGFRQSVEKCDVVRRNSPRAAMNTANTPAMQTSPKQPAKPPSRSVMRRLSHGRDVGVGMPPRVGMPSRTAGTPPHRGSDRAYLPTSPVMVRDPG